MHIKQATKLYEGWLSRRMPLINSDLEWKHQQMSESPFSLLCAFGLVDEKRLAADGAKGAHRRIDTARNVFQGCGKKLVGFGPAPHARRLAGATEKCQRQEDRRRKQRRQVAERQAPISVDAEGDEFDRVVIIGTARLTATLYGR